MSRVFAAVGVLLIVSQLVGLVETCGGDHLSLAIICHKHVRSLQTAEDLRQRLSLAITSVSIPLFHMSSEDARI